MTSCELELPERSPPAENAPLEERFAISAPVNLLRSRREVAPDPVTSLVSCSSNAAGFSSVTV